MIVFLSNADTEILALRTVIEGLPADVPPVRAANPSALGDALPDLDGAAVVLVRLLGGRRAWEGGFDELRFPGTVARDKGRQNAIPGNHAGAAIGNAACGKNGGVVAACAHYAHEP